MIKKFYQSFTFIISFMLMCIIISVVIGEKALTKFLILVLTSQLLINADDTIKLIKKFTIPSINGNTSTNNDIGNEGYTVKDKDIENMQHNMIIANIDNIQSNTGKTRNEIISDIKNGKIMIG